ncbi:MAG: hypothetical protein M0Z77_07865 [Thermoplasmatales archaeon]|nr:hypothetical protein [Thermoplasmatales archaeon]
MKSLSSDDLEIRIQSTLGYQTPTVVNKAVPIFAKRMMGRIV